MNKLLLWGGGGAALLAILFWPKSSSAQPAQPPGPKPPGPPGTGPHPVSPWGPGHWPPTPFTATVTANVGGPNIVIRSAASTTSVRVNKPGQNPNGSKVTVTQTGLKSTDGSPGEWWAIQSPTGNGFARAVDATGFINMTPDTPPPVTAGAYAPYYSHGGYHAAHPYRAAHRARVYAAHHPQVARQAWEHAVATGQHPSHIEAARRAYAASLQGRG
jgi:hypothetical protein